MLASNQHIKIDLSSWYKTSLAPKIERIQKAVEERKTLKFRYYSPQGEGFRKLEPYFLLFQWASWYVWGYCPERQDFRLFKLNRMLDLDKTEETFQMRDFQMPDLSIQKAFPNTMEVKAVLKPAMKWRLIEEFGPDSFQEEADGSLLFSFGFADKDNLFSWLLSFGDQVRLLEPKNLVPEFTAMVKRISEQYER